MPHVARNGDKGPRGVIETQRRSHTNLSDNRHTATVADPYRCTKKGHKNATLKNGCFFFKIDKQPVAMQYATVATCGCRILEGSTVHRCCPHLDAKARRLAEREIRIEAARDLIAEAERRPGESRAEWTQRTGLPMNKARYDALGDAADELERLNRDVRRAEASQAVYQKPADTNDPRFSGGNAGLKDAEHSAPEAMLNLRKEEFRDLGILPEEVLNDDRLWENDKSNYYAAPYYDELTGETIIAYRGTEIEGALNDPESKLHKDMVLTNLPQGIGEQTEQYDATMRLAAAIRKSGDRADSVVFTGHSKGGGQASAAGIIANRAFVSFNPATLSPMTPYRFSEGERTIEHGGPLGTRYRTHFDYVSGPLDAGGDNVKLRLVDWVQQLLKGDKAGRLARAVGDTVFEFPPQSADTHSMRELIDAIEARKANALAAIDQELAGGRPGSRLPPIGSAQ